MKNLENFQVLNLTELEKQNCYGGCKEDWSWAKRLGCLIGNFFEAAGEGFEKDPSAGWNVIR